MKDFIIGITTGITMFVVMFVSTATTFAFARDLYQGITGEDVRLLQTMLNQDKETLVSSEGPGSLGSETIHFGPATYNAVLRFQQKYSNFVLFPLGLTEPTGYVGESTREFITLLFQNNNALKSSPETVDTNAQPPVITSIEPSFGRNGETITLSGTGFDPENNTIFVLIDPHDRYVEIPATHNGTEITFVLNSEIANKFERDAAGLSTSRKSNIFREHFPDHPLTISVENKNGRSEPITYTLTVKE